MFGSVPASSVAEEKRDGEVGRRMKTTWGSRIVQKKGRASAQEAAFALYGAEDVRLIGCGEGEAGARECAAACFEK